MAANVLVPVRISTTTLATAYRVMALRNRQCVTTMGHAMVGVAADDVADVAPATQTQLARTMPNQGFRLAQITLMTWKTRLPRTLSQVIARRGYVSRMTFRTTSATVPLMSRNRKLMTTSVIGSGMCQKM